MAGSELGYDFHEISQLSGRHISQTQMTGRDIKFNGAGLNGKLPISHIGGSDWNNGESELVLPRIVIAFCKASAFCVGSAPTGIISKSLPPSVSSPAQGFDANLRLRREKLVGGQ